MIVSHKAPRCVITVYALAVGEYNDIIGEMSKLKNLDSSSWESLIRSGQGNKLRAEIIKLQESKFSRLDTLKLANFSRRVGLPQISIKLLKPLVRSNTGLNNKASSEEKAEYSAALIREGVVGEGLKILNSITDKKEYPESMLYSAFGLFTRWDYEASIPLLKEYVELTQNEYQRILGHINLVASLIFTKKFKEANSLLQKLVQQTQQEQFKLSHSYCLELYGQYYLQLKDFEMARNYFQKAGALSANSATSMPFLVRKWLAITDLLASKSKVSSSNTEVKQIEAIKAEALNFSDYETVRTCDLHLAIYLKDKNLAKHVYFGSSHRKFRENVAEQIQHFTDIPEQYDQLLSDKPAGSKNIRCFDMHEAKELDSDINLKNGQAMHRVFKIISSDFYKPVRATEIFSLAFPNEYFDQSVSINRVHQIIKRLREWLDEHDVPIEIIENNNSYRIQNTEPYLIRWFDKQQVLGNNFHLNKLHKKFKNNLFKLSDASDFLDMPSRSTSRLIQKAVGDGAIEQVGGGASTKYRIIEKNLNL